MRSLTMLVAGMLLVGCEAAYVEDRVYEDEASVPTVRASMETTPVATVNDDAADDPAIWLHPEDPAASLILATDKKAGLGLYALDGSLLQFIPAGEPNNIDLRQGVTVGGWRGDLAAASNRDGDVVTLFSITADGGEVAGSFPAQLPEPYGACMGRRGEDVLVFITYKTGQVHAHVLEAVSGGEVAQRLAATLQFDSQLEGCVFDDATGELYVGEEARGLWHTTLSQQGTTWRLAAPQLLDSVDGRSGITADVEGLALYGSASDGYVIVSSQGNDSFALYDRADNHAFIGRFRIGMGREIDGAQETDGIEATAHSLGPDYPAGVLVVQDGFNVPVGEGQNFKLVDWRAITEALALE